MREAAARERERVEEAAQRQAPRKARNRREQALNRQVERKMKQLTNAVAERGHPSRSSGEATARPLEPRGRWVYEPETPGSGDVQRVGSYRPWVWKEGAPTP